MSLLLALALVFALAACGGGTSGGGTAASPAPESTAPNSAEPADTTSPEPEAAPVEVVVFAAASMEATLTEIAELYKEVAPNVTLTYNFDSSGTLKTQIEEGAVCDLFISAGQKQMNQLDAADTSGANEGGLDFVNSDTRINLVENKVVLAVPDDNPAGIESFQDLASDKLSLLCIGNEDVPVGSYSLEILDTLGIDIAQLEADGKVTYGTNVTEVANQVKEAAVDCGIIYATDAFTYELNVVDAATEDMCSQVIYPAAVMKSGTAEAQEAAQAFLDYLHTDAGAIAVIGRESGSGTRDGFESITGTEDQCVLAQELSSTGAVIEAVRTTPGAIGYASLSAVQDQKGITVLTVGGVAPSEATVLDGSYAIQRPFVFATRTDEALSDAAQAFFDFATSTAASDLIANAGAVPVAQ